MKIIIGNENKTKPVKFLAEPPSTVFAIFD